jgi:hypothetical protein
MGINSTLRTAALIKLKTRRCKRIENKKTNNMPLNEPKSIARYMATLSEFMTYKDGLFYAPDEEFTQEQLLEIVPNDLYRWLCMKAFDKPDPGPNDNPMHGRSSSLMYYKKAISHFMPNTLFPWNVGTGQGNPTRSKAVNDLIKAVKKKEVRKQGKPSNAKRALDLIEMKQVLNLLESFPEENSLMRYTAAAFVKFMIHIIGRPDDTAELEWDDLHVNTQFPFALLVKMCWSKNISEERESPEQIILGAMDPLFCLLIAIAIHLELWMESGLGYTNDHIFGLEGDIPDNAKDRISKRLKADIFQNPNFVKTKGGPVGIYSLRKFPSTFARRNGCGKDDVNSRGRWRKHKGQVDAYLELELPWPDAKVASTVCIGGPCRYALKENSGVTDDWLLAHVVPNIFVKFEAGIALTLARPLLWACMDNDRRHYVPSGIRNHVQNAYQNLPNHLPDNENPVKKILLVVSMSLNDSVNIDDAAAAGGGDNNGAGGAQDNNQINAMLRQDNALLRQDLAEARTEVRGLRTDMTQGFALVNRNVRRIGQMPVRRAVALNQQANQNQVPAQPNPATLSRNPRTLFVLWQEYMEGIGGRKAARLFTAHERGRVKYNYHRRKVAWEAIATMVRAGNNADVAIDKIYEVYGRQNRVTVIINRMRQDRVIYHDLHPQLRI